MIQEPPIRGWKFSSLSFFAKIAKTDKKNTCEQLCQLVMYAYTKRTHRKEALMKKTIALGLILLALCALPAFSGVNMGTVAGYYSIKSSETNLKIPTLFIDSDTKGEEISAGMLVKGSSYFDLNSTLGINYMVRVGKVLELTENNTAQDVDDMDLTWDVGVGISYQMPVAYQTLFEAGAGIQYANTKDGGSGLELEFDTFSLSAYAEVNIAIQPAMYFTAGVHGLMPVYSNVTATVASTNHDAEVDGVSLALAPYVGISYAY